MFAVAYSLVVDLPRHHPQSYHTFMWENLFKHIDIKADNVNLLDGNAKDLDAECKLYEQKIRAAGGIDLFVGGKYAQPSFYSLSALFLPL